MRKRTGPQRLVATQTGWRADWLPEAFAQDREMTFTDGCTLAASCGVRCKQCPRYIAWLYRHPTVGDVLIRRVPAESDDPTDALTFMATTAKQTSRRTVKADADSELSRIDGRDGRGPARLWCVECRRWRTITLIELRSALANKKSTIRANSADIL